jgi:hypothetical protein
MTQEEGEKAMNQMRQAAVDRFRKKLEQYVAGLDENLTLTPDQKARLQSAIEAQHAELTALMNTESGDSQVVFDKIPELGPPALEAVLAASLSPEQKSALETYKSKERARQADTKALKKLALLQGIFDFKEGQRDEVYRLLSESAAASLAKTESPTSFDEVFAGASGIDMDPYDLGIQQLMMESAQDANARGKGDHQSMLATFRQKVDQLIEDKVNELKPILDEAQLEKYREELRSKGLGHFGTMLNAVPEGE